MFHSLVYCGVGPGGVGTGTASVCTESWKIQNISEKIYAISRVKEIVYLGVGSLIFQKQHFYDRCTFYHCDRRGKMGISEFRHGNVG